MSSENLWMRSKPLDNEVLPLQRRLAVEAPGLRLRLSMLGLDPYQERLERGEIDIGLGMGFSNEPGVHRALLYEEPYACAVRQDHPAVGDQLTLEQFAALSHVIFTRKTTLESTPIDRQLAEMGLERHIALQVPSFPLGLAAARTTDLVISGPRRFLESAPARTGLRVIDHPVVTRVYQVFMVWHARGHLDPANQWLRAQILDAVRAEGPS